MSVLDRAALESSPLADLHAIASELSLDGYRRLRRAELIERILVAQGGEPATGSEPAPAVTVSSHAAAEAAADEAAAGAEPADVEPDTSTTAETEAGEEAPAPGRRRRGRRGGRGRSSKGPAGSEDAADDGPAVEPEHVEDQESDAVEGVVELLPNGSGFVRVTPPDPSDDDVYISAAQVKRCELVAGDRITGPKRAPRRSERFASLVRIETINGSPAAELADSARFDDLPSALPTQRLRLGSEDPTVKAIEWLTPFGRGSRVAIVGASRAGKTEALRRLAGSLVQQQDLAISLALIGIRPEEMGEWAGTGLDPVAAVSLVHSPDAAASALELVIDQARRVAARGGHAVVLVDTLDGLPPLVARRAMAGARNLVDRGSLTIIATAERPVGGETTVIALDLPLTSTGRFPAVDLVASGTIRPDLLVGEAGAEAIALARAEAIDLRGSQD